MIAALALGFALCNAQDAAAALADAVDRRDAGSRRAAALALALRKDVSLEEWMAAAAGFRPAPGGPDAPGAHRVLAELPVLKEIESTTLHIYLPAGYDPAQPAPLLLAFHGSGGEGASQLAEWRATADAIGALICAPTDPESAGGYAFTPRERAAALAALRWMRRHYDVDENRIHLVGASRGGHLAWDLGLRHPDLWASVSPRIGGPTSVVIGGRNNLRYCENLTSVPIRDLQGADDDPKLLFNLRLAFGRLKAAGATDAQLLEQQGIGHAYDHGAVDWTSFLGAARRNPFPEKLRWRAAWDDPERLGWARFGRYEKEVKESFAIEVGAGDWDAWEHERKVRYIVQMADERTAELRVERAEGGILRAEADGLQRAHLLLPAGYLAAQPKLTLESGGKSKRLQPRASAKVLLLDFAERFDRSFLPVAEIEAEF
jgi:dienelactone hydrolase